MKPKVEMGGYRASLFFMPMHHERALKWLSRAHGV